MTEISQTLDRGLQVLELLDASSVPLGVRELARSLELGTAIVQRLINTLEQRGFVEQVVESRRYRIGYRARQLGQSSRNLDDLERTANTKLQELAEQYGLNAYLGAIRNDRAVYLLAIPSRHRFVLRVETGETMSFHSTALGKVLLAAAGEERSRNLLGPGPLPRVTPATIVEPSALIAILPKIRAHGYAESIEENLPGVVSVGAPIRNSQGTVIAAISAAIAAATTDLKADDVTRIVVTAATAISRSLGCPENLLNKWDF